MVNSSARQLCVVYVRNPSLWKENKANSISEDDAKSAEVGTRETGYQSDDQISVILCIS